MEPIDKKQITEKGKHNQSIEQQKGHENEEQNYFTIKQCSNYEIVKNNSNANFPSFHKQDVYNPNAFKRQFLSYIFQPSQTSCFPKENNEQKEKSDKHINPLAFCLENYFHENTHKFHQAPKSQGFQQRDFQRKYIPNFINSEAQSRDQGKSSRPESLKDYNQPQLTFMDFSTLQNQQNKLASGIKSSFVDNQNQQKEQAASQNIELNIRSQLIRRSRKYQISTNNAHKKYINCLKNLFYEALSQEQINQFEKKYIKQKSSRAFFFIILVYVKYRFTQKLGLAVKYGFQKQMNERILEYEEQIFRCSDFMLKNYRYEQIHEIQIALKAIEEFYQGNTCMAIEYLYRKDKHIIVKQNHFRSSLKFIQDLEKQFSAIEGQKISQPHLKDHYHRKISSMRPLQKYDKQKQFLKQAKQNEEPNQSQQANESSFPEKVEVQFVEEPNNQVNPPENQIKTPSKRPENIQQTSGQQNDNNEEGMEEEYSESQKSEQIHMPKKIKDPIEDEIQNTFIEQIIFPPIPPFFYLPEFDEKYGHVFRRMAYIKKWKELNRKIFSPAELQFQNFNGNKSYVDSNRPVSVPPSLAFGDQSSFFKRRQ